MDEVRILVTARDETGPALASAETRARGLRGHLDGIRGALKGLIGPAVAFGGVELFKNSIESAEHYESSMERTKAVLESTHEAAGLTEKGISGLTNTMSNQNFVSKLAVREGENLLLTFTGIHNAAGKNNDIFNQATQATIDMTAAMNHGKVTQEGMKTTSIQVGKALQDPIKGMTTLRRVGVTFTQQQQDQIKAMVHSGHTMDAQKMILHQLGEKFKDTAKKSATSSDKLKLAFQNLSLSVGQAVLPAVEKLAKALTGIINFVQKNSGWLVPLLAALGSLVLIIKTATKVTKLWRDAQLLLDLAMDANPVVLITLAVIALIAIIVLIATKTHWFQDIWKASWKFIKRASEDVWNWLKKNWPYILGILTGPIGLAVVFIVKHWKTIENAFKSAMKAVKDAATTAWHWIVDKFQAVIDWFKKLPGKIGSIAVHAFDSLKKAASGAVSYVIGKLKSIASHIPGAGLVKSIAGLFAHGGIVGHAAGGVIGAAASGGGRGGLTWVGEQGPELVRLPYGSSVRSNPDSMRSASGGRSGNDSLVIVLKIGDKHFGDLVVDTAKKTIRTRGGITAALGS